MENIGYENVPILAAPYLAINLILYFNFYVLPVLSVWNFDFSPKFRLSRLKIPFMFYFLVASAQICEKLKLGIEYLEIIVKTVFHTITTHYEIVKFYLGKYLV